jgi:hypothetical protein
LERGLIKATNSGENFEGWVVGFYGEWSDTLAKLPVKLADAQVVRWQSKYGREPTIQQRAWLVSKVRSDIAMMATKLNAQVIIKNLQNMHEKSLPPMGARRRMELEYQDWARLQGRGPRTGGPFDRTIGWRSWCSAMMQCHLTTCASASFSDRVSLVTWPAYPTTHRRILLPIPRSSPPSWWLL